MKEPLNEAMWGWTLVATGAVSVLLVSVFYVLSPVAAVTPNLAVDFESARRATLTDHGFMRLAGSTGVLGDVVLAVGAAVLACRAPRGRPVVGWLWLAVASLVFTAADALVGFAVRPAAAAALTFAVVKPVFDVLTAVGAFSYGLSALLVANSVMTGALRTTFKALGAMTAAAGVAIVLGAASGLVLDAGLILLTAFYAALSFHNVVVEWRQR
jgi:hypothetical protein